MSDIKIQEVTNIIRDAGGKVVGRTRLQKIAYLLYITGLDNSFNFVYKHYGPFSEQLASSAKYGALLGDLTEQQDQTNWGATYSTYTVSDVQDIDRSSARYLLASKATDVDSVELELAATAVLLSYEGYADAWGETQNRKPEKATEVRLANAKKLLARLASVDVPRPLPANLYQ